MLFSNEKRERQLLKESKLILEEEKQILQRSVSALTEKIETLETRIAFFNDKERNIVKYLEKDNCKYVITLKTVLSIYNRVDKFEYCLFPVNIYTPFDKPLSQVNVEARYQKLSVDCDNKYCSNRTVDTYVNCLVIRDFQSRVKKRGYGTILMTELLSYAKKLSVPRIYGYLSFVDERTEEDKILRNHFYEKFGFSINEEKRYVELITNFDS